LKGLMGLCPFLPFSLFHGHDEMNGPPLPCAPTFMYCLVTSPN
jgi:hypothetical protein